jgi:hypothetical protein
MGKRLVLFFGLAYLFLAALASGLVWTVYTAPAERRESNGATPPAPQPEACGATPPEPGQPAPSTPPAREPEATEPGLHIRPDGSRYLIMPLPADVADRLRGRGHAFAIGSAR